MQDIKQISPLTKLLLLTALFAFATALNSGGGDLHYEAHSLTHISDKTGNNPFFPSLDAPPFPQRVAIFDTNIVPACTRPSYSIIAASNDCRSENNRNAPWEVANKIIITPTYSETIAHMQSYITNQMANEKVMGLAIGLIDGDDTVWLEGFGYADYEAQEPVREDTVFHIGSVSKVFTTTILLKLMEEGLLDLNLPVTNYISDFSTKPRFQSPTPITVKMLLNHESGLPGDLLYSAFSIAPLPPAYDWLLNYLKNDYPTFPPMLLSVYCNTGFVLSEGVVRALTGEAFTDYAKEVLFYPLQMDHSSYLNDLDVISENLAHPYFQFYRLPDEELSIYATGSMYSSIPDLLRFLRMMNAGGELDGEQFLSTNSIALMTKDESSKCPLNLNSDGACGLGWDVVRYCEFDYVGPVWIKSGGTMGYTAYIATLPTRRLAVAVAANTPNVVLLQTAFETLRYALLEKTGEHWPTNAFEPSYSPAVSKPQAELNAIAGLYITKERIDEIVASEGSIAWRYDIAGNNAFNISNMVPRSNGWFSAADLQTVEISFTNAQNYTALLLRQPIGAYQWRTLMAHRYEPAPIPIEWKNRYTKLYLMDNMHPLDYFCQLIDNYAMTFSQKLNMLYVNSTIHSGFLEASNANLAFTLGLDNRGSSSVQIFNSNGVEKIMCGGFTYIDAQSLPTLATGFFNSISSALHLVTDNFWVKLPTKAGLEYRMIVESSAPLQARLCNNQGKVTYIITDTSTGAITFKPYTNTTYYTSVYGNGYNTPPFKIRITVLNHGGHDIDGDGKADPAAILKDGTWVSCLSTLNYMPCQFKLFSDGTPLLADIDGDGMADPVIVENNGTWKAMISGLNYATFSIPLNKQGTPLLADFDGDGMADPTIVEGENWYIYASSAGYQLAGPYNFELGDGIPIAADFDGDGKADPAMVAGTFWIGRLSSEGYVKMVFCFEKEGYPIPGDYDGDGKADPAIFNNGLHVWLSGSNYQRLYVALIAPEIVSPIP
jgi:CubicO group peptidase (beta-lactamase class C family)